MKCPRCGKFMQQWGRYTNDHCDSWEVSWRCNAECNSVRDAEVAELTGKEKNE